MKSVRIIIINIIIFVLLFFVTDFIASVKLCNWIYSDSKNKIATYVKEFKLLHRFRFSFDNVNANFSGLLSNKYAESNESPSFDVFRPIENINSQNSVLILGADISFGTNLNNNETFSYFLGKLLPNYRIYNRSKDNWTTSHSLYQLEAYDYNYYMHNIEYIIYCIYPESEILRNFYSWWMPYYKLKDNQITRRQYSINYFDSPIFLWARTILAPKNDYNEKIYNGKISMYFMKKMFEKMNDIIYLKSDGHTKFVIFCYDYPETDLYNWYSIIEDLKDIGIIVVSLKDLSDTNYLTKEYQLSAYDTHPNARAWREITPLFVKYLQDRGCNFGRFGKKFENQ